MIFDQHHHQELPHISTFLKRFLLFTVIKIPIQCISKYFKYYIRNDAIKVLAHNSKNTVVVIVPLWQKVKIHGGLWISSTSYLLLLLLLFHEMRLQWEY